MLNCLPSFQARGAKSRAKFLKRREKEEEKRKEDNRFKARLVRGTLYRGAPVVSLGTPLKPSVENLMLSETMFERCGMKHHQQSIIYSFPSKVVW
jgi:hypothetical protein